MNPIGRVMSAMVDNIESQAINNRNNSMTIMIIHQHVGRTTSAWVTAIVDVEDMVQAAIHRIEEVHRAMPVLAVSVQFQCVVVKL
jgi:hypothetical protein